MVPTGTTLITPRSDHTATSIGNGDIVVIAGYTSSGVVSDVWVLKMNSLSSGYLYFVF